MPRPVLLGHKRRRSDSRLHLRNLAVQSGAIAMESAAIEMSQPRYIDFNKAFPSQGKGFCRYCTGPLPRGRSSWCSDQCHELACIETNYGPWQWYLARIRGFICEKCGKNLNKYWGNKDYDIHHIIRFADGGTHKLDNLLVLCKECHKKEHAAKPKPTVDDRLKRVQLFLFGKVDK